MDLNSVMVDLGSKPKCEIICPYCQCITKLGLIKQVTSTGILKFNSFNFDRHVKTQHLGRKRRALADLSNIFENQSPIAINCSTMSIQKTMVSPSKATVSFSSVRRTLSFENRNMSLTSKVESPRTTRMMTLQNDLHEAQCRIKELEAELSTVNASHHAVDASQHKTCQTDVDIGTENYVKELETTLQIHASKIHALSAENIMLQHKAMNAMSRVRVFCRLKPSINADEKCFNVHQSDDAMQLKIGEIIKLFMRLLCVVLCWVFYRMSRILFCD